MQTHGPKRVYTPQSLEFWFERLEADWEGQFDAEQLERGRRMYCDGEIREIELGGRDAIVHRRIEKRDEYAVIEWDVSGVRVRSSSTDQALANAIAIAGLHEIEELLADEINSLLPGAAPAAAAPAASGGNGSHGGNGHGAAQGNGAAPKGEVRELLLSFTVGADGLGFRAFWKTPKSRIEALGNTAAGPTSPPERARLIALAAYARKAHFRYRQDAHTYTLEALNDIPGFLRDVLPHWKKQFAVEADARVGNLAQGLRSIEVEAVAEHREGGGLNLRWIFRAGEKLLSDEQAAALLSHGRTPMLLPELGLLTMAPEKWEGLNQWRRDLEDIAAAGPPPPYLIFSLFSESRIKITFDAQAEAWRRRVLSPPENPPVLPDFLRNYQRRGVEWMHHL